MHKVVCGILGLGVVICTQAGVWQVQRKKWKEQLIEDRKRIFTSSPVDVRMKPYPWMRDEGKNWEYHRVQVVGTFLHEKEMLMMRAQADQPGYKVYTPIVLEDGSALIVNRGWMPAALKDWRNRKEEKGKVVVDGVLRTSDFKGQFTPENMPTTNEWHYADLSEMTSYAGISDPEGQKFYVHSVDFDTKTVYGFDERGGQPVPGRPGDLMNWWAMPETHMSYAVFWFSSSFVCLWFLVKTIRYR